MRPATIRRLLVFGVCALGVGALYLMPSVASTPSPRGGSAEEPERLTAYRPVRAVDQHSGEAPSAASPAPPATQTDPGARNPDGLRSDARADSPMRSTGISPQQRSVGDDQAPSTVSDLTFPDISPDRLTVRWPEASDNVAVTGYRVWLNGFRVADTTGLQVAVRWFNDGSQQQVVQVRAIDASGNVSVDAPARLVQRPAASPTSTPTSSPTAEPSHPMPSASPSEASPGDRSSARSTPSGQASIDNGAS
ncbi:MAG TPA: hypothetical protein VFP34_10755 [Microlunatus sp.]|nr:hypothetical protein [Microlunatus sp.]